MDEVTLNDLLECSVCLERLDTSSKVLPCQHTFCRKCLQVIVASHNELRCPECRILIEIKIDDLPPNVLLMRILGGLKSSSSYNHVNNTKSMTSSSSTSTSTAYPLTPPPPTIDSRIQSVLKNLQKSTISTSSTISPASTNRNNEILNYLSNNSSTYHQNQRYNHTNINNNSNINGQSQSQSAQLQQQQQQQQHQSQIIQSPKIINAHEIYLNQQKKNENPLFMKQQQQQIELEKNCPYAKALYDYDSKAIGDLKFKKGDLIYLQKRIDHNWLVGELNGMDGAFPVAYVQIMIPLPLPQCKALYDFRMGPMEEEGCLTFGKGAIINVLRRVDHNWAEGRINDCIGIFPIAFVEMNQVAKFLMDLPPNLSHHFLSRSIPPRPYIDIHINQNQSSSSDTSTTSPISNSNADSSTSSSTTSNSPLENVVQIINPQHHQRQHEHHHNHKQQSQNKQPQQQQQQQQQHHQHSNQKLDNKEKRHSLTTLMSNSINNSNNLKQINRHSAEILNNSDPEPRASSSSSSSNHTKDNNKIGTNLKHKQNDTAIASGSSTCATTSTTTSSAVAATTATAAATVPSTSHHSKTNHKSGNHHSSAASTATATVTPHQHNMYIALYSYKRQKSDELELKKGSIYYVTEKCQDGWFKGANRSNKTGVFPGNYVAPIKNHTNSTNSNNHQQNSQHHHSTTTTTNHQSQQHRNKNKSTFGHQHQGQHHSMTINSSSSQACGFPPQLPPRCETIKNNSTINHNNQNTNHNNHNNSNNNAWKFQIGEQLDSLFYRKLQQNNSSSSNNNNSNSTVISHHKNNESTSHHHKDRKESTQQIIINSSLPAHQQIGASTSTSTSSSAVNFMKRIATNIKRSKSPPPPTTISSPSSSSSNLPITNSYSMDNPVFEDSFTSTYSISSNNSSGPVPHPSYSSSTTSNSQSSSVLSPIFSSSNHPSTTINSTSTTSSSSASPSAVAAAAAASSKYRMMKMSSHPVHVRSGSCPSQLLQSLPVDVNNSLTYDQYLFGSQRLKGHKERPSIFGMRHNHVTGIIDGTNGRSHIPNSGVLQPQQLSTGIIATMVTSTSVATTTTTNSPINGSIHINNSQQNHHHNHHQQQQQQYQINQSALIAVSHPGQQQPASATPTQTTTTSNTSNLFYHRKSQSLDAATISSQLHPANYYPGKQKEPAERFRCIVSYPPNSEFELELNVGDIVFVNKKRDNGWYKGVHNRTGKCGLFPASFVEPDI